MGALAFLDAKDGHLVVLPGDSPADAWARYTASPESGTGPVSVPAVVTFVYRADVPKAPETVTASALQQQQALRTSVRRGSGVSRSIWASCSASSPSSRDEAGRGQGAGATCAHLAEDLAAVRKFMLQTAQLGWLNHELVVENANGMRKMATASQELTASSAKLEETLRQLSESSAGQLKELAARLDAIQGKIQNIK